MHAHTDTSMPTYLYVHTRLLKAQCIVSTYLYIFVPKRPAPKRPCAKPVVPKRPAPKRPAPKRRRQNVLICLAVLDCQERGLRFEPCPGQKFRLRFLLQAHP